MSIRLGRVAPTTHAFHAPVTKKATRKKATRKKATRKKATRKKIARKKATRRHGVESTRSQQLALLAKIFARMFNPQPEPPKWQG